MLLSQFIMVQITGLQVWLIKLSKGVLKEIKPSILSVWLSPIFSYVSYAFEE